ncbi:LysR family transcriptional regulator [Pontibacter akesuensis]|uniref:DNA-binding transcriptional regulator, LysR family n=1 Tax=Pontibacter akesuensis TaxID=388950 RepID=A0A1I7FNJ4_9BACT|nr:LysR family transcriptional regulator [Pontibacter akesuensis]GHA61311.1 transcriptional regulator [Pontibacter akesuensis]SFU37754.1 DNA-binding transcriptional regulator, LysR family [Pontibacter akesuensis]
MLSQRHEIFFEVARLLSFTKASQTLFISQSAISKHVKALEEYYKIGLFERHGNSVSLTPAGQLLYQKLLVAKELQHALYEEFKSISADFLPQVRMVLGSSTTISLYILPPVLSAYLAQNPNVQITLKNRNSENILKALVDREIDLGIIEGINKVSNVSYTPFIQDEVVPVCSSKNPLRHQKLQLQDLYKIPLALREYGSGTLAVLEEALLQQGIRLHDIPVKIRLGGTEALKNFVRADNTCLSFLPRPAVLKELESGELLEMQVDQLDVRRTFYFIQRKGTENDNLFKNFIQFTKRQYSQTE